MKSAAPPAATADYVRLLLERWQESLELHAKYVALDEQRYWHVQPWPKHQRPAKWIVELARQRVASLTRIVEQRTAEGDRAFLESLEIMSFLATLVGLTTVERFIPLASPQSERRDVLSAKTDAAAKSQADAARKPAPSAATRHGANATQRHAANAPAAAAPKAALAARADEATREMPQIPASKVHRMLLAQRAGVPLRALQAASNKRDARRPQDKSTALATKAKRSGTSDSSRAEQTVMSDAVRLLGWGKQWHELGELIGRLAERPSPSEIRRILRTHRPQIEALAKAHKH